ncbi:MAG TPA: ribonuclease III [Acidimicrobiales bacterium]|nr:ribonuclease III [Acidimicrobiales bacterium]HLM63872.1 ribonuclease III [Acidimicrobiales bacterium]
MQLPVPALDELAERLGVELSSPEVLAPALVHRSWCAENLGHDSNERLEFLGDAVLGVIITDHAYHAYPALSEGELTDVRKAVVNAVTLAEVADELHLGRHLLLGKGEEQSGGREKPSILADALEAILGAVYVSAGMKAAHDLVLRLLGARVAEAHAGGPGGQDYKSRLQELAARHYDDAPRYDTLAEGPDHARRFHVTVSVAGVARGTGDGRSKKQAEQVAARDAYTTLVAEVRNDDANA